MSEKEVTSNSVFYWLMAKPKSHFIKESKNEKFM
nr:MAG TPA: hypothetical protein [Caudoviricetes sp.]DAS86130.1 MAG TPA: hypothetical protein [Caudoviricetes sp.]